MLHTKVPGRVQVRQGSIQIHNLNPSLGPVRTQLNAFFYSIHLQIYTGVKAPFFLYWTLRGVWALDCWLNVSCDFCLQIIYASVCEEHKHHCPFCGQGRWWKIDQINRIPSSQFHCKSMKSMHFTMDRLFMYEYRYSSDGQTASSHQAGSFPHFNHKKLMHQIICDIKSWLHLLHAYAVSIDSMVLKDDFVLLWWKMCCFKTAVLES